MFRLFLAVTVLILSFSYSFADESVVEIEQKLIGTILKNNPDINTIKLQVFPLEHMVKPASTRPDPVVGVSLMNFPLTTSFLDIHRTPMTQVGLTVQQKFPPPGVLNSRAEVAEEQIKETEALTGIKQLRIAHQLRLSLRKLALVEETSRLIHELEKTYTNIASALKNQYESGKGSLDQILDIQLNIAALQQRYLQLNQIKDQAVNSIEAMAGYTFKPDFKELLLSDFISEHDKIIEAVSLTKATKAHPEFNAYLRKLGRNQAEIKLHEKLLAPGFGINASYGYRADDVDFWSVGVTVELPLWRDSKQREKLLSKMAETRVIRSEVIAFENQIRMNYESGKINRESISKQIDLYEKELLPQLETVIRSQSNSLESDLAQLPNLLKSIERLIALKENLLNLRFQYIIASLDLETSLGIYPEIEGEKNEKQSINK